MARTFDELVNAIADSFKDEKKPIPYTKLSQRVEFLVSEDYDNFFTIIKERGDVYEMLDGYDIAGYAVELMVNYLIYNKLVKFFDNRCG